MTHFFSVHIKFAGILTEGGGGGVILKKMLSSTQDKNTRYLFFLRWRNPLEAQKQDAGYRSHNKLRNNKGEKVTNEPWSLLKYLSLRSCSGSMVRPTQSRSDVNSANSPTSNVSSDRTPSTAAPLLLSAGVCTQPRLTNTGKMEVAPNFSGAARRDAHRRRPSSWRKRLPC